MVSPDSPLNSASDEFLRLASWQEDSAVDGPGLRFTIFAQGCPHRCPGCHNPETHLAVGGIFISVDEVFALYRKNKLAQGITLSGGEPFLQAKAMSRLALRVREAGGDVVTYTGYVYEKLLRMAQSDPDILALLRATDLLIDGPFILDKKSLDLPFRGSSNQRLIPLNESGQRLILHI